MLGWRLGLQAVTGVVFLTFFLGTFYRSASLYHPQRRAILHLKSQKRKIKSKDKDKNKMLDDTPPFFDFTTLKSRTGVNIINILHANFSYERLFYSYILALNELSYKKFARLTLMKLTRGVNIINIF